MPSFEQDRAVAGSIPDVEVDAVRRSANGTHDEQASHHDPDTAGETLRATLIRHVNELRKVRPEKLVRRRGEKFAAMGAYSES